MIMMLTPPRLDGVIAAGFPTPVNGVVIVDSVFSYTGGPGKFASATFRFDGITTDSGVLTVTDDVAGSGFAAFDGVQWHEDQPSTTASAYAIRAKGTSYTGPGSPSIFRLDGNDLITTYFGTFTPWQRMSTNNNDLTIDRAVSAGSGSANGVATIEIGPWPVTGTVYMSASFDITYILP